jgi:hypothetical protein
MASLTTPRNLIVTLGQSLNSEPGGSGVNSYFQQMQQRFGGRARTVRGYIPGIGWLQWKQDDWRLYYHYWATKAERVVFNMNGGQGDYAFNRTGAQAYADMVSISQFVKGLSSGVRVIGNTIPGSDYGIESTVAAASNGVNVTTFAGAGVLNVASTTAPYTVTPPTSNVIVQTSSGQATISYTGTTATTLTGCTTTAGTGTLATGNYVRSQKRQYMEDGNTLIKADSSTAFDRIADYFSVLPDASNTTYFQSDKVHETAAGAKVMIDYVQPMVEGLLI